LAEQGAVPRYVGAKLGTVNGSDGEAIDVEISMETGPSVLYDAIVLPDGEAAVDALARSGHAMEFLKDQYRHCKPILALGAASALLEKAGIPAATPSGDTDEGILRFASSDTEAALQAFVSAITEHRHFARETDPPTV
jgi:catalase